MPDLATSWSWSEDGTELTFKLRQGIKWHDGKPFTAADVKCTYDLLLGKAKDKLRLNPRKAWYRNLDEVTTKGDDEAIFHVHRPQPALITLLASGYSPIYPCHVSPRDMRTHPIGTGPFKFVEFKPNERIKVARNPDYWKPGRPYLDGIEYTIVPNRSTAILAFVAGKFDMTWPYILTVPLLKDIKNQAPQAICELRTTEWQHQSAREPRQAALRQCRSPAGDDADLGSQILHRHSERRAGKDRRRDAAAARRAMGPAAGAAEHDPGLRPRRAEEPQGGARDHAEARLRRRQAISRSK